MVLASGLSGASRRCCRPWPFGSGVGQGAALAQGVRGLPEVEGGSDPPGSASLVLDQGSDVLDD